jgi:hypothetical protein
MRHKKVGKNHDMNVNKRWTIIPPERIFVVVKIVGSPEAVRAHREFLRRSFAKKVVTGPIVLDERGNKAHCFVDILKDSDSTGADDSKIATVEEDAE